MPWTVACFCGTLYTTPPGRCPACGTGLGVHTADGLPDARPVPGAGSGAVRRTR